MLHTLNTTTDIEGLIFRIGMAWRILFGFLRLALGLSLLRIVGTPVSDVLYTLMGKELIEDPSDTLFQFVHSILQHYPISVTYFLASYLIFWGLIDVVLSIAMLKHKLWAFPLSFFLITVFLIYEAYRFTHTHSLTLLWVIVADAFIFYLIYREYNRLKILYHTVTEPDL